MSTIWTFRFCSYGSLSPCGSIHSRTCPRGSPLPCRIRGAHYPPFSYARAGDPHLCKLSLHYANHSATRVRVIRIASCSSSDALAMAAAALMLIFPDHRFHVFKLLCTMLMDCLHLVDGVMGYSGGIGKLFLGVETFYRIL